MNEFIANGEVVKQITALKKHLEQHPLNVSDTIDNAGHQYVDLVQEGGGVLGIALVGYTYALEQAGIRFASLAGTSAGAINTAFLGFVGTPEEEKSIKILSILNETDLSSFVDGGFDAELFIDNLMKKRSKYSTVLKSIPLLADIMFDNDLGINSGEVFMQWISDHFRTYKIHTAEDLILKINQFPQELLIKDPDLKFELAIIAGDVTTSTKVVFPQMSDLYFNEPASVDPALFVRASMSIPIFFDPLVIKDIPKGIDQIQKWQDPNRGAYYLGDTPDEVTFVDGGIMSNFPIDVFHRTNKIPSRPTFGVKLGLDRIKSMKNDSILKIAMNSFNAARQMRDHDILLKNKDYNKLIAFIDDENFNWLDFNMKQADKIRLFKEGVKSGCEFIKRFDWNDYKNIRNKQIIN